MFPVSNQPPFGQSVLLYDSQMKKWIIAALTKSNNTIFWCANGNLFFATDDTRFKYWEKLPEAPE